MSIYRWIQCNVPDWILHILLGFVFFVIGFLVGSFKGEGTFVGLYSACLGNFIVEFSQWDVLQKTYNFKDGFADFAFGTLGALIGYIIF